MHLPFQTGYYPIVNKIPELMQPFINLRGKNNFLKYR